MTRVDDAAGAVYEGLRALEVRRYLCAMWIVCGELRAVYEDRLSARESVLMASTLQVVRDVVIRGEATADAARDAAGLSRQWGVMTSEREAGVMPGQWNAWMVFRDLASEITLSVPRYESAERVDLAATDRWREHLPGSLADDPDEEVDDSSPMARTLAFLTRAIAGVAGLSEARLREAGWDPALVQEEIFGKPPVSLAQTGLHGLPSGDLGAWSASRSREEGGHAEDSTPDCVRFRLPAFRSPALLCPSSSSGRRWRNSAIRARRTGLPASSGFAAIPAGGVWRRILRSGRDNERSVFR